VIALMSVPIKENAGLAPLTTLGVGGAARFLAIAREVAEVEEAAVFARRRNLPLFVLGGGSNLVVSDAGWNGLVLRIGIEGIEPSERNGRVLLDVGAGVAWDDFVQQCVAQNLAGLECLSGIPGSVGGTPVQNVGAYGQEVSETITSLLAFDMKEGRVRELSAAESRFRYRESVFNREERSRYIIMRVRYALMPGGEPGLRYADLQKYFAGSERKPSLAEVRKAVLAIRSSKGMLLDPSDPESKSAGSFFKNPVLSEQQFLDLAKRAAERGVQVPSYPALSKQKKVSAAWLVEHSGFHKGYTKGRVGISSKHALALVNRGGAAAAEIVEVMTEIQRAVQEKWGIRLETEPVLVGF
jgi:UDP-N-acetylmuramate dehydrogenase